MSPRKYKLCDKDAPKPSRPTKTNAELQKVSRALWYEIWMFHAMVWSLIQDRASKAPEYKALVESFVQHTKNLIEFLYPTATVQPDTVIASDFLADWREDMPGWLREVKTRANKLLAHLTYDRVGEFMDNSKWDCREIGNRINETLAEFFRRVPRDLIGDTLWNYWTDVGAHLKY